MSPQSFFKSIEPNLEAAATRMPGEKVALLPEVEQFLAQAEELRDIFPVERYIQLEVTQESTIKKIDAALRLDHSFFVLDKDQRKVFQFDDQGKFIGPIGRVGDGPGEYLEPANLKRCGNLLAVSDGQKSAILLYDTRGNHIRTLSTMPHRIYLRNEFVLTPEMKLYMCAPPAGSPDAAQHAVIDFSQPGGKVLFGFGQRFGLIAKRDLRGKPGFQFNGFCLVGNYIWTAAPYDADIEVFDLEGRKAGLLKSGLDSLTREDFEGVDLDKDPNSLSIFNKLRNDRVFRVGSWVLVTYFTRQGPKYSVFDGNGVLLKKVLKLSHSINDVLDSYEDRILGSLNLEIEHPMFYEKFLSPHELQALASTGWDIENFFFDNPYLVVGLLAKPTGE